MILNCKVCNREFKTFPSRTKIGKGKYCSKKCSDKATLIKTGVRLSPKTEIKKGERKGVNTEFKRGERPWNWKGGIEPLNRLIRKHQDFYDWRELVFKRDNFKCRKCCLSGRNGAYLHPHHVLNFSKYPNLRFVVSNGITFCAECHWEFHRIYKKTNNTREQLNEFLKR